MRIIIVLSLMLLLVAAMAVYAFSSRERPPVRKSEPVGDREGVPPKALVDVPRGKPGEMRTIVVAGGCFWCEEALFKQLTGVTEVTSGYAGGTAATANYEQVHESNHAEAVKITYDAAQIGFAEILRVLMAAGDPTVKDGQEPDYGHQYRMAVFYENDEQKQVAEAYLRQVAEAKVYDKPLQVTVEPLGEGFFRGEEYHQDFVTKHPNHPYVCRWSREKIARIRAAFPDQVKAVDPTVPAK